MLQHKRLTVLLFTFVFLLGLVLVPLFAAKTDRFPGFTQSVFLAGSDGNNNSATNPIYAALVGASGTGATRVWDSNTGVIAGAVSSARVAVNPISGQAGVDGNTGASSAKTIRTVAASNDPGVTHLATVAGVVSSSRAAVNLVSGQAGVDANTGAATAKTVRTVAASDSPEAVAAKNEDYATTAGYTATIGASSTIATAFTASLPANLVRIVLIPRGDVYYKFNGTASAATAKLPAGGLNMPIKFSDANTLEVFASSVVCDLLVCTPRN
jgi:hypothetical protein